MHRCSLLCLAVAQTVSSPAGSLYDSSIGLQRFPSEEVCPWQHTVKLQRGNFRVKMPDWVFDSFQPLTDVFNGVHSLPFTQPQQMESAVMLLLCLATSLFLFSPSFFPSRFLCFISWPVLRKRPLYHISPFKRGFIWEMGLYYEKLTSLFWNKGVWYRRIVSFRTQNFRKCEKPFSEKNACSEIVIIGSLLTYDCPHLHKNTCSVFSFLHIEQQCELLLNRLVNLKKK